ncbi:MAG: cytochrome c oxidase assembly protein [Steroidobacteraceae bacterium]
MRRALLVLAVAMFPAAAIAHSAGGEIVHSAAGEELAVWRNEISLLAPLVISGLWYGVGFLRLGRRVSSVHSPFRRNGALFGLGWLTLVASLLSPLHELGEISFTAHMAEHELLMLVAAPLMALSRPISVFLWACPARMRRGLVDGCNSRWVSHPWRIISDPVVTTALQISALWLWHMPSLFDRALQSEWWHALQHLSFLGSSLLFWWSLTRGSHRSNRRAIAALCLFITSLASGALGALMAVSSSPWYAGYAAMGLHGLLPGGLTAAEDQQLAGLIMWIPGGLVHFVAALVFAYGALKEGNVRERRTLASHA